MKKSYVKLGHIDPLDITKFLKTVIKDDIKSVATVNISIKKYVPSEDKKRCPYYYLETISEKINQQPVAESPLYF